MKLPDGTDIDADITFRIQNFSGSKVVDKSLHIKEAVYIWDWHGGKNQRWILKPQWQKGAVLINSEDAGYVGFPLQSNATSGTRLYISPSYAMGNSYDHFLWTFKKGPTLSSVTIHSFSNPGMVWEVASNSQGERIVLKPYDASLKDSQLWKLRKV